MARQSSSTTRGVGGDQKLSAPCPKYTKVVRNGVVVEMEVIPVGGDGEVPNARPFVKPPRVVETATCGTMVREKKSASRAGADEQFSLPSPKRTKVTRDGVKTISVEPALGTLRKRMAAELDALHGLLRKAELLSSGNNGRSMAAAEPRSEAPAEASIKTPPAQRTKVFTPAKIVEFESAEDKNEFVDICGGVSPAVPVEKAGESGNSPISSSDFGSSSSSDSDSDSDSGSSSSSDSDSDSESDSDPDETVDVPVPLPQAVLPQENGTSVQPAPEPASEVVQSKEPEKHSKTDLIAKAKIRRQLLEIERAVLPDESIHARDLRRLCIAEYGRPGIMQRLGLFLKADA
nr:suppressor protein SRP40-like [Setaria viridis]